MLISLTKDPSSRPGNILAHVEVSASDDPSKLTYSHSFRFKVLSSKDGEIIIYIDRNAVSKDLRNATFSFDLEKCRNKECIKKNPDGCPEIAGKTNRLLVADIFHTMPTQNTLQYFGTALFKALFSDDASQLLQTKPTHQNGSIFLQTNDHDLDAIPWEYAKNGTAFVVHSRKFARILPHEYERPQDPLPRLPLRIVVAAPDPLDLTDLNLADLHLSDQFQNFINNFREGSIKATLERVLPATVNKLNLLLAKHDDKMATVFHFMGHCIANTDDRKSRGLLFEAEETFKCIIANTQSLVTVPTNLRLAFLSACDSREVARVLVQNGIRHTIGSFCPLPDDIARRLEAQFYHYLVQGLSVDEAMWRMRMSFQNSKELRESDYLAGAMILYSTNYQIADNIFSYESGELKIELNMFPNNLGKMPTSKKFFGRKKQLADLISVLRRMATRTNNSFDVCTITGIGGQGKTMLAKEAVNRIGHFFPGGIFVWKFDDNKEISARDYLRDLAGVLFSEDTLNSVDKVEILGQAISSWFKASSLLILDHADTLKHAATEAKPDAKFLIDWLQQIISNQGISVKILATSQETLGWPGEKVVHLGGLTDSDIKSGCRLFAENLNPEAKTKILQEKNSKNLLRELVIHVDGHPLSLKLLGNAASLPDYLNKPLERIVHEHFSAMLSDADVEKELKRHFKPKIDALTEMERSFLYICSLFDGLITAEILALVRYFVDYNGDFSVDSVTKSLEQFCKDDYFFKENNTYKIHVGFREGLRQHNNKLNIGVCLPKIGPVDTFTFGIPSKQGKSNVLEWQLRNIQSNSDNAVERTFGIQYRDIVNNLDASNHELEMAFRGLVVFTFEASENFPDAFANLSAKQIKSIVEKRELPFILCFKHSRTKVADQTVKNMERNFFLKKVMNTLQEDLRATHLIIRAEPLLDKLPNINAITKKPLTKMTFKRKLAGVPTYGDFVGREKELKRLKELLDDKMLDDNGNRIRYITIFGFGGMGKTTLAIQAVKNFNSERVLVLSFVKNPSFNSMILKIAEFLYINIKESEDIEADVLNKLDNEETVLFYLDNMETLKQAIDNTNLKEQEEAKSIYRFFSETPSNVKILATSRVVLEWPGEYLITLTGLEPHDGMQVFRQWTPQRLNDFNNEDAKKISDIANGHPLSIRLLGGAFNKCKRPISEFISNMREHLLKAKDSLDRRYDSINTCIQYSYDYLDETLKQLLCQFRWFITPFSATIVSKALGHNTTSSSMSFTKDDLHNNLHILCQQSWLNEVKYIPTLGDWRPRFMESDIDFYTLHPRLQDFLNHQFNDIEVTEFDDPDIQFCTALCYATGFGVVNDFEKQIEWCTKAAENGHLEAQLCLAACYEYGAGGVSLDKEKAFYWYLKAAETGDSGAQQEVVSYYYNNQNIRENQYNLSIWAKRLHANGTQPLQMKFDFTLSLLHRAAENDQVDLVRSLIEQGSVKVTVKDKNGRTPLHLAVEKGHMEVVKLLAVEFDAEINVVDKNNRTPLHLAASNGHTEIVRLLITELGADIRTKDMDGRTLLHMAAAGGIDVIRLLVTELGVIVIVDQLGEDVNANDGDDFQIDSKDENGQTPLHVAAQNGHIDIIRMLAAEFGANVNIKDKKKENLFSKNNGGRTPLHIAAENGHFEVMKILVAELGANKDEKDNDGATLLHYAVKGGLHAAIKSGLYSTAVNDYNNIISLLIAELGTDINLKDAYRRTLLHWAVQGGQVEGIKQLMLKFSPTKLDFQENNINAEGAYALAESLKQNTTLTELNLFNNKIGVKGACALAEALKQNITLIKLNLGANNISTEGTYTLAKSLKQNVTLTELNLENNNISTKGAYALAEFLKQNITLTKLNLQNNKISTEGANILVKSLKQNISLTELNLSENNINTKGIYALAESLKQNITLTKLNLEENNINIKEVYTLDNYIDTKEAYTLAESLKQNIILTKLNLSGNNICAKGAYALAEFLKQNITLIQLYLKGNNIGIKGAYILAKSLKQNITLTELDLEGNNIGTKGACSLAESLKQNITLTQLSLIGNGIDTEGACALIKSLKQNTTLTELNLSDNNIDTKSNYIITESLNRNKILTKLVTEFETKASTNDKFYKTLIHFEKNFQASNGLTPLHAIAAHGHIGLMEMFVSEFKVQINISDNDGWTPLHIAAACGHVNIVRLLVNKLGADPNSMDNDGRTPLHRAADGGYIKVMNLLIVELRAEVEAKDNNGYTPLHRASLFGYIEGVRMLITEHGANANAKAHCGETPLHEAAKGKAVELIELLTVGFGADINAKDNDGRVPIDWIVRDWYIEVMNLLVTDFEANEFIEGQILLHWATGGKKVEFMKLLDSTLGTGTDIKDNDGQALIHYLSRDWYIEVARLLVVKYGADPNAKYDNGQTPLHLAAQYGRVDLVRLLVAQFGADINAVDNNGSTPFHIASKEGHIDVVKLLASEFYADIAHGDNENTASLHYAALGGCVEVAKYLIIDFNADVHAKDDNGLEPLGWAAMEGHVEMVKVLVREFGADLNAKGKNGLTPLQLAEVYERKDVVNLIINELGVDGNDKDSESPIDEAHKSARAQDTIHTGPTIAAQEVVGNNDSLDDADGEKPPEKNKQHRRLTEGLVWKTTVAVLSAGAVICLVTVGWMELRGRLRR